MSKMISVEAVSSALAVYETACLNYYRTPCKEMLDRAIDAEHICVGLNIKRSELTRIRLSAMHAVEAEAKRDEL